MVPVLVLHGPNLNLLGEREPEIYGRLTMAEIDERLKELGQELDLEVRQERLARVLGDILPSAEQAASMAEFAYGKGAISVLDLIDARRSLRQARTEAAHIRADFAKSLSAFKLAIEAEEN